RPTSISVGYNPVNKSKVFSSGDYISGRVTLELVNDCKIDSLCVKLKGKAEVKWTEHYGKTVVVYHNKEKYFSIKQFIIQEKQDCLIQCVVMPYRELPSSFKGSNGKILYTLEANLSRSMRLDCKAKAEFTVVHKANLKSDPLLMVSNLQYTHKLINAHESCLLYDFDTAVVMTSMLVCFPGEGIKVVASIQNKSSRDIKPKYCLYRKYSYFAKGKRKVETKDILKEVGEVIPPSADQTVTRIITIPSTTCVSILNCNIIKAEYRLRVYLDVKYASDPEIKFPIVILPASQGPDEEQPFVPPAYGFEAFAGGTSFQQNPTAFGPSAPPPPYGTYGMYPSLSDFSGKS
uniref:Arrestin C-terminal-like domain-containing protein n=1 Tax=Lates calcarifer TaxID=8187 RepID=A0A4W6G904_LATCA